MQASSGEMSATAAYNEIQIISVSIEYIHEFIEIKSTSLLMCIYTLKHRRGCFLIFNSDEFSLIFHITDRSFSTSNTLVGEDSRESTY